MITQKQIEAAAHAILVASDNTINIKLARLLAEPALEAAESAAWSDDMDAAPRDDETWLLLARADVEGCYLAASWEGDEKHPWGTLDHNYAADWPTHWRHFPAPPPKTDSEEAAS